MKPVCPGRFLDREAGAHLAAARLPRRALFLDRDGVVNADCGYVHSVDQTHWLPGIFDLARTASTRGLVLVIVTNQAGIGRGYYSEEQFLAYTEWMHEVFREHHAPLLATYFCPHHPSAGLGIYGRACDARKPHPGMISAAASDWDIDLSRSVLIGDKLSDVEAAAVAGVGTAALIESGELLRSLESLRSLL